MLTSTNTTVTRDEVWTAFRRTHDVRLHERSHGILLLMDGSTCTEIARWLYRDEETLRSWVHACNEGGLQGLERGLRTASGSVSTKPQSAAIRP